MACNNIPTYLTVEDFESVGVVAKHCNLTKLCIAAEEAKNFDLIPLFCFEFVQDLLSNWDLQEDSPDYTKYQEAIKGSTYEDANGKLQNNVGFKKLWVYFTYARYILINGFNDTANGIVQKQNEWSMPTALRELNDFSNKYRNMALMFYDNNLGFLCENKADFPSFEDCKCKLSCGCSGKCSCGKTKKLTGFKFRTVKK